MKNTVALITGASGGIGYEFAKLLAKDCSTVILVARGKEKLVEVKKELELLAPVRVFVLPKDLAQAGAAEELFDEVEKEKLSVDILINNAGFGDHGAFVDTDWAKESDMLALNITALTHMTKLFLKGMIRRKRGRIVNVASAAAFQPGPFMAVYYASKAYVLSFSEAIANELKGTGVTVTVLCPGPTTTGFAQAAGAERSFLFRYRKPASPSDVARYGYNAMMKGKTVAIHGLLNKLLIMSTRLSPRWIPPAIVRRLHRKA